MRDAAGGPEVRRLVSIRLVDGATLVVPSDGAGRVAFRLDQATVAGARSSALVVEDPYAMGWDAGDDMDDPLPCPFKEPMAAKLWRQGYTARVNDYIAKKKSAGGVLTKTF
jgi:hypothetical protein